MFLYRVFLPFAFGYFLSQLFRSVNAVVSADLIRELSLSAWTVGFLTSAYFLAFAGAQLPIGVALDRFGPRRTEAALMLFAALGAVVFAASAGARGLILGRALIGLGVASCLMASFHAFVLWAARERLPFLNGAVMAVGAAGALTATAPVEWAVTTVGWRSLFGWLAGASVASALLLFSVVPEKEDPAGEKRLRDVVLGIRRVFSSKAFWSVAPLSIAHQGAYLAIQSLWAGPWLRDVARLDRASVADHLLLLAAGMGIGFLGLGFLAERLSRKGVSLIVIWAAAAAVFQMAQLGIVLGWIEYARALWLAFGVFGASGMLSYVLLTRRFPVAMAGRVNTGLNVLVFTSAFVMQAGIGAVIEFFTPPGAIFSATGYRVAFGAALALQAICLLWLGATASWRSREVST